MDLKNIRETLARLTATVDGWANDDTIGALERDWALEKLRSLYEAIRFADLAEEAKPVPAPAEIEKTEESEPAAEDTAAAVAGLDLSGMLALEPEPEPESESESEPEPEIESEPEPKSEAEQESDPELESKLEEKPEYGLESTVYDHSELAEEPVSVEPVAPVIPVVSQPEPESESKSEPEPEPAPAPVPEAESGCKLVPAPAPEPAEPVARPSDAVVRETTLFGPKEDDDLLRHRRKQRVIMSLYGEEAGVRSDSEAEAVPVARPVHSGRTGRADAEKTETVTFEEISVETVVSDEPMAAIPMADLPSDRETPPTPAPVGNILGEVINHDVKTLADTIEPPRDVATDLRRKAPVYDLRQAVGINDRFLLIRDLFGGDSEAYDTLMQKLNTFESLDDCVIYLTENYTWNANSESVRLLMELLERKFA